MSVEEKLDELINLQKAGNALQKANNALFTEIKEFIKVFSDFVLEVKPQDAQEEIEKLE